MDFGITIKPDISIDRILDLTRHAESSGFSFGWIFDSHVIWKEPFPLLTLMAANTDKMRLGTCVTNPAVRDVTVSASLFATLNLASGGRMELGIGRGDSSRRVLGKKPTTLETLEEFVRIFRNLNAGKTVDLDGVPTKFPWTTGQVPRVWVAGYGPKALRTAGRIGDEVVDRFCLIGPVAEHRKKLERLRSVGVSQFNIYLMSGDEEKTLEVYQREILPHFKR